MIIKIFGCGFSVGAMLSCCCRFLIHQSELKIHRRLQDRVPPSRGHSWHMVHQEPHAASHPQSEPVRTCVTSRYTAHRHSGALDANS